VDSQRQPGFTTAAASQKPQPHNCAGLRSSNRTIHPVATAAVWLLLPDKYQLLLLLL